MREFMQHGVAHGSLVRTHIVFVLRESHELKRGKSRKRVKEILWWNFKQN